jgi:ribonucleotide monophosphatase NagD (HAD superfamily)
MIIAVDWDGTIVKCDFPRPGIEIPGAVEALKRIQAAGHFIILWTCREEDTLADAVKFLADRGFVPDVVNEHDPEAVKAFLEKYPGRKISRKIYADLYIDDKHLGKLPPWPEIERMIMNKVHAEPIVWFAK